MKQTFAVHRLENRAAEGFVTFGSAWKKGELKNASFALEGENGKTVPVQSRVTAWWPDQSIKWAAHTADAAQMGTQAVLCAGDECADGKENAENQEAEIDGKEIGGEETGAGCIIMGVRNGRYLADNGCLTMEIPACDGEEADALAENICLDGQLRVRRAVPVLYLEERTEDAGGGNPFEPDGMVRRTKRCQAVIRQLVIEENGPLAAVVRMDGCYRKTGQGGGKQEKMRFRIRIYLYARSQEIRFVHTFFFDGDEKEDFLKGLGICFETELHGRTYERHVRFDTDKQEFHEAAVLLNSSYPRLSPEVLENQLNGGNRAYPADSDEEKAAADLPVWQRYSIFQDSAHHYRIQKQTQPGCCSLTAAEGKRAHGAMEVCGADGGLMLGIRDFWQKYPSGLEIAGLAQESSYCTAWFYSPEAEAYDFRHYDTRSYQMSSYEGFSEVGACANGIAVTSECTLRLECKLTEKGELRRFSNRVQKPPVYTADPLTYHEKQAFGTWSLVRRTTPAECFLEDQLEKVFDFYRREIDNRNWYGLFDYGDVMHTYDPIRHCWRYDMGGFAWQNTELVPTYWLWLYFMRTGREDVFTVAEAMSRHCGEVDCYHFGPMKGIGSRHNVRHWGCSCKEPRIGMAGHHRFYYYLTGDFRTGDVMEDAKDADESMKNLSHFVKEDTDGAHVVIRSGPDWTSFLSNWMTQYERTLDHRYLDKITRSLADVKQTPFGLASGPSYRYDDAAGHMIYLGENDASGNMHLQICMGGPEIWIELADMLEDEALKAMLKFYGRFYFLSPEEKGEETGGQIKDRPFAFPWFASDLGAYAAKETGNRELANIVWKNLLNALIRTGDIDGFSEQSYGRDDNGTLLTEIPWIKTNFAAQLGLNVIITLDQIREALPQTMEELEQMVSKLPGREFHRA